MATKTGYKKWIILLILLVIIGVGVIFIFFNPKRGLKLVLPDLNDVSLVKVSIKNDTAYLSVDMVLENKSIFKLNIDTVFYKIILADSLLFNETKALNIKQKPGDVTEIEMPLRIPMTKTIGTVKSLQNQDSTYIEIDAYIVYNTMFGRTKIPVSKRIKIEVPVPPHIELVNVEISEVDLSNKTVSLDAAVKIINKSENLDLSIHKIHYKIFLGDNLVSSEGFYDKPIIVKPRSETNLNIPITIKINKIAKTIWKYIINEKLSYKIEVNAEFDENSFYKETNIPLQVMSSGEAKLRKKK